MITGAKTTYNPQRRRAPVFTPKCCKRLARGVRENTTDCFASAWAGNFARRICQRMVRALDVVKINQ